MNINPNQIQKEKSMRNIMNFNSQGFLKLSAHTLIYDVVMNVNPFQKSIFCLNNTIT
jgi:hypothetical protein